MNAKDRFPSPVPLLALLIVIGSAIGCTSTATDACVEDRKHANALLMETSPQSPPPEIEASGLRAPANRVDVAKRVPGETKPACPGQVFTFVRTEAGTDCDTYKAEIAGWSDKCVGKCDDAARLAEAIASAQVTCADFCRRKRCPGPMYAPPAKCATSGCYQSRDCDPEECPFRNRCMLLQGARVWNCVCVEL